MLRISDQNNENDVEKDNNVKLRKVTTPTDKGYSTFSWKFVEKIALCSLEFLGIDSNDNKIEANNQKLWRGCEFWWEKW